MALDREVKKRIITIMKIASGVMKTLPLTRFSKELDWAIEKLKLHL